MARAALAFAEERNQDTTGEFMWIPWSLFLNMSEHELPEPSASEHLLLYLT